jgi:hypothetical protein
MAAARLGVITLPWYVKLDVARQVAAGADGAKSSSSPAATAPR